MFSRLPGVVRDGVAFPLDEVFNLVVGEPLGNNTLHFILRLFIMGNRYRLCPAWDCSLMQFQLGNMKDIMNGPERAR